LSGAARLRVEKLGMSFGGLKAVDEVDLEVPAGKITAIIGPNGAGKTTFFNVVAGFYSPTAGRVFLDDQDVTGLPPYKVARLGIARTFQTTQLFAEATVLDNVVVGRRFHTRSNVFDAVLRSRRHRREEDESRDRARESLDFVGALKLADALVANISQEARKRVAIALALATEPRVLLLDEPAAGMNSQEASELQRQIRFLRDEMGLTVVLVEHNMAVVMNVCETIHVVDHGETIAEGTPSEIKAHPRVLAAYLGQEA